MIFSDGTGSGFGTIAASVRNHAIFRVSAAPERLLVTGNCPQTADGRLEIVMGGTNPDGTREAPRIGSSAAFVDTISLELESPFADANGQTFSVVRYDSRSGDFGQRRGFRPARLPIQPGVHGKVTRPNRG